MDMVEGNPVSESRMTYSLSLFLDSKIGGLPSDFRDYPIDIVSEVRHLQQVEAEIIEDKKARMEREAERKKKGGV